MKKYTGGVGYAWDGAIVQFRGSACYYMKVCSRKDGIGGYVDINKGSYISTSDLPSYGLNPLSIKIVAKDIDDFYSDFYKNNS